MTGQTPDITGKRIAFLAGNGVEQAELTTPWNAVESAGGTPVLLSAEDGTITATQSDWEHADSFSVDQQIGAADPDEFDAVILPGGTVNADSMRANQDAVAFVRTMAAAGKPVSAVCHAPWVLIEAGLADGRRLTSYSSLRTDLVNAGAEWVDEEVVTDQNVTTSRDPDDLDAFCARTLELIAAG